mmetsp:Transcript_36327/g.60186  ORF Transcript_36327/g.60186 Transcript_36327/m.60186 type:complete len:266 (-) Transcript_36327:347-1144(-)
MVAWANGGYGNRVRLLMLCMETGDDGNATARSFGKRFQIPSTVLNGYIDSPSEAPTYGQLGCGGFIVLGKYGEFAAARTVPAFLDKGLLAFAAVEQLLSELGMPQRTAPAPAAADVSVSGMPLQFTPVGHAQMDQEHEDLAAACAALREQRSLASLRSLRDAWAQHSEHEEALFEKHDFAGHTSRGERSGTKSHCRHHRAILSSIDLAVQRCEEGGCCAPGLLDAEAVEHILSEMQRHSDVYDNAYAGRLGASEDEQADKKSKSD